ncbi:MAG: amino acid ABC transporter permease [Tropicimonas sp.]|uniref:amino acid ABC transporter permease n=1 Tax=Tropicimonas sp. TaxID=2067044 RepID=UPI003A8B5CE9
MLDTIEPFFHWLAQHDQNFAQSLYLFVERLPRAMSITVRVTLGSCLIAFVFGFLLAIAELSANRLLAGLAGALRSIGQGIPLPPMVFLIYFTALSISPASPVQAATAAIGLFTIPYAAAIFRGGIRSIPVGQVEVAQSLGMTWTTQMRRLTLPVVLRIVLPALGHLAIVTLLNSSFASVIGVTDITGMSRNIINAYFSTKLWLVTAAVYFLIAFPVSRLLNRIERRVRL